MLKYDYEVSGKMGAKIINDIGDIPRATQMVAKVGEVLVKGIKERLNSPDPAVREKYKAFENVLTEDLTMSGSTALYTTAIAGFIERALRPKLVAEGIIKKITDFKMKGYNSIKIPLGRLITASDLPDTGTISYDSGSYSSLTITISWKYAANKITYELLQHSAVDLISEELYEIGQALARKIDSDIIAAIDSACTSGNGNLTNLGSGTYITYSALVDGIKSAMDNYAEPDILLISPETWDTLMKDTDVKSALHFGTIPASGSVMPQTQQILGLKVVVSPQVDDDAVYIIDSKNLGYFVEGSDVQTFDGRVSGTLAFEVIGAVAYGVGIAKPKAIYKLAENAS